jgi:hypothetical protein
MASASSSERGRLTRSDSSFSNASTLVGTVVPTMTGGSSRCAGRPRCGRGERFATDAQSSILTYVLVMAYWWPRRGARGGHRRPAPRQAAYPFPVVDVGSQGRGGTLHPRNGATPRRRRITRQKFFAVPSPHWRGNGRYGRFGRCFFADGTPPLELTITDPGPVCGLCLCSVGYDCEPMAVLVGAATRFRVPAFF